MSNFNTTEPIQEKLDELNCIMGEMAAAIGVSFQEAVSNCERALNAFRKYPGVPELFEKIEKKERSRKRYQRMMERGKRG